MIEPIYKDPEFLLDKYWGDELTLVEVAKEAGCSETPIQKYMREYNIPRRSFGKSRSLKHGNVVILSKDALEFITGELLGDMSIVCKSNSSALISYGSKYEQYLEYLRDELNKYGIKPSKQIYTRIQKLNGVDYTSYHYRSLSYPQILELRRKWYPDGKKIVPKDITLTPLVCRQWYIGDGSLRHPTKSYNIEFATCGFSVDDTEFLKLKFKVIGFDVTIQPAGNRISIKKRDVKRFLEYIGPCPIECYEYKWRVL